MNEKKEEIILSPMTKAPTSAEMSKGRGDNTNNATKKFDYTAIADRLRTVSWSNDGLPTATQQRNEQTKGSPLLKMVTFFRLNWSTLNSTGSKRTS